MELYPVLPGESIELRAFPNDGSRRIVQRFLPSWDDLEEAGAELDVDYDVYFGVAPRIPGPDGVVHGRLDNVPRCPVVWLDLDAKGEFTKEDRLAQLALVPPTWLVDSGGGFHAYWVLEHAMAPRDAQRLMKGMAAHFRCDDTSDPTRILRVPNTRNYKTDPPRLVDLIHSAPERVWDPHRLPVAEIHENGSNPSNRDRRAELIKQGIPEGGCTIDGEHFSGRDAALFELACYLRDEQYEEKLVLKMCYAANTNFTPSLTSGIVAQKVRSAFTREPAPPIIEIIETEIPALLSGAAFPTINLHDLGEPKETAWLWEPYVPENRLILLDGEEGIGKGLGCSYLAARFSSDHPFLWFSAEDDPTDDLKPRILASADFYGVSRNAVHVDFVTTHPLLNVENEALFSTLEKTLRERDAKVLVFDPGRSYLGPRSGQRDFSMNNEADIRPTLQRLNTLSRDLSVAVVFVHHWNKNTAAPLKMRSTGSAAFRQVVRLQMSMLWDPVSEEGAFGVHKSNIGPTGFVRTYQVKPAGMTAVFVPSEQLDPAATLEIWGKQREKQTAPIHVIEPSQIAENVRDWAFINLEKGERWPSREQLRKLTHITSEQAKTVVTAFVEEKWIIRSPDKKDRGAYLWNPQWTPEDATS